MRALPLIVATALAAALTPTVSFAAPTTAPAAEDYSLARSTPVKDPIYPDFGFAETDALHYHLGLDWDGATLKGVTTVKVRAATSTSSLRFNLGDALKVSGITVGGKAATFTHSNRTLTINTGALASDSVSDVVISYAGKPAPVQMPSSRKGNLGWNVNRNGVVSTLQEPYGAYTWYPVNDHPSDKAYFDATITTKSSVMGVFNGVLTGKKSDGGKTIANWHLDKPAASYLTTIAIDNFRVDEQKMADGKTFYIWYTDQDKRWLSGWRQESKRAYDWLSAHAGPNHFASMGMVVVDTFSAMETQTMMTMGSRLMQGSASTLIAHEMAHQWFGDTVTTKTWRDTWLNEGWTEYMEEAFSGSLDPARSERACRNAVGQAGQAGNPKPGEFAMPNVYQCPIPAIAQVRADLGDAKFFELAAGWVHDHAYTSQERSTFEAYVQSKTGRDYRPVFSQWLDKVQPSSRW